MLTPSGFALNNHFFILSVFGWRSNRYYTHYLIYLNVVKAKPVATLPTLILHLPNLTAPNILLLDNTTFTLIVSLCTSIFHRSQSYNYYTKTTIQKLKLVKTMFYIKNVKGTLALHHWLHEWKGYGVHG